MEITGILNKAMPANTMFTVRLGGIQNPRYIISDGATNAD
jgi:hypothetical protein